LAGLVDEVLRCRAISLGLAANVVLMSGSMMLLTYLAAFAAALADANVTDRGTAVLAALVTAASLTVQAGDLGERRPRQEPAGDEAGLVLRTEETVVTGAFAVVQQLAHTGLVRGDGPAYGALELLGRGRPRLRLGV